MATRTIVVAGNGTNQLSYQLDGPDVTEVEAVLAEIDASGAGDTTATLLATSPAGSDVAAVPQGQAVAGGGQGRATWALRLADDAAGAAPPSGGPFEFFDDPVFVNVPAFALTRLDWVHNSGASLLNLFPVYEPALRAAGVYTFSLMLRPGPTGAPYTIGGQFRTAITTDAELWVATAPGSPTFSIGSGLMLSVTRAFAAGDRFDVHVIHDLAPSLGFSLQAVVQQVG